MIHHRLLLTVISVISLYCCHAQEGDVIFNVKALPVKVARPVGAIINYTMFDVIREGVKDSINSYKLFILPGKMQFTTPQRTTFNKGGNGNSDLTQVDFKLSDSTYVMITGDTGRNRDGYELFNFTLNQQYPGSIDWLNTLLYAYQTGYKYSVCTDTAAVIKVGLQDVPCYKIESVANYDGDLIGDKKVVTYISKQYLLPVWEQVDFVPSVDQRIKFTLAQRREWLKKTTRIFAATSWFN